MTKPLVRVCTGVTLQEGNTETSLASFCPPPNCDRKAGVTGLAFALTARLPSFPPSFVPSLSPGKRGQVRARIKTRGEKSSRVAPALFLPFHCVAGANRNWQTDKTTSKQNPGFIPLVPEVERTLP